MNQKFTSQCQSLQTKCFQDLPGIIIFHQDKLFVYQAGRLLQPTHELLKLNKYHLLKDLAHGLVYYSLKHNLNYQKMNDLCQDLQTRYLNQHSEPYYHLTIAELMKLATEEYLQRLHTLVQSVKLNNFNNQWPDQLLILVVGPNSPRFGHPAMQYFSRLTKQALEINRTCYQAGIDFTPEKNTHPGRKVFYLENNFGEVELQQIVDLGISKYVEADIYSKYYSMETDILAEESQSYLARVCQ